MREFVVALGVLLIASGCGGSKRPAGPATDPNVATIDRAVAMLVDMGGVVMAAGNDCDRMASGVNEWIGTHGAERKRVNEELLRIQSPATEDTYRQRLAHQLDVVGAMMTGVEGCSGHDGFMRAWAELDE